MILHTKNEKGYHSYMVKYWPKLQIVLIKAAPKQGIESEVDNKWKREVLASPNTHMSKDEQTSQWGARSSGYSRQDSQTDSGRQRGSSWRTPKRKGWAAPGFETLLDDASRRTQNMGQSTGGRSRPSTRTTNCERGRRTDEGRTGGF
eukprot:10221834-Heterocapsa_arctica.AAC.1